ncbi:pseudouridine synthase [Silanimonas sp.]|uniref:pseudouridine synthase n=1 Tax=Silanimonas sp. TaxID=1929290 RepID=UPI0022CBACD7|nr:pseudouridine synthase [Silanimonas sp.]MCZ8061806.1 pseudouridine synthase [Silanimonas sp.]
MSGTDAESTPDDLAVPVLYADAQLAVVDKPARLMAHDSGLARGENDFLADRLRAQFGRPVHLIHRLDRATSGCLLLAFDKDTARALGEQFMTRAVEKTYLAVCRGWPEPAEDLIDHPLDGGPGKPEKKPAQTAYRVLATGAMPWAYGEHTESRFALLECAPHTGRFRQIRRHLKHRHHHLIGDTSHGDGARNRMFRMHLGVHRMLLHAWRLAFMHPVDGRRVVVEAPLDAEFVKALAALGWTSAAAS